MPVTLVIADGIREPELRLPFDIRVVGQSNDVSIISLWDKGELKIKGRLQLILFLMGGICRGLNIRKHLYFVGLYFFGG